MKKFIKRVGRLLYRVGLPSFLIGVFAGLLMTAIHDKLIPINIIVGVSVMLLAFIIFTINTWKKTK